MNNYLLYYKQDDTIKLTKFEDVYDMLYYLKATVPTVDNINQYINDKNGDKVIKKYLKSNKPAKIIQEIKDAISKIDNKIPLYDELKRNLFIVEKELVYKRVIYDYYRFPDKTLIEILKERETELKQLIEKITKKINIENIKSDIIHKNIKLQEEYDKLKLMLDFLDCFNIEVLETTYMKVFYLYANEVGKNITVCIRPSFLPHYRHIKPYYSRSELINMALNMELIKPSNHYYTHDEVMKLCSLVKQNDISADTIMKHQEYIIKNNKIGVIQYYSLQGSYFINQYLRNLTSYEYKNPLLEEVIGSIWELIIKAPEFDKEYTLYRFIHDDSYLKHLNIGDTFIDPSFISTTRDPFYRSETYKFGFILIKINIPAKMKGVGLCIESYSHFPEEQEIILAPLSILRLDKKNENALYYHTDDIYSANILTRYEFTFVGNEKIRFVDRPLIPLENKIVDFLKIKISNSLTVYERIKQFIYEHVNDIYQFRTKIGVNEYDLIVERYDSTNAYKKYYAATTNNGFSIYTIKDNYMLFVIELGEDNDETYMYVNFYFKYASANRVSKITENDFIEFLAKVAYHFGIKNVIVYAEYSSCDLNKQFDEDSGVRIDRGGNYCNDFYKYFKFKERRFQNKNIHIDSIEVRSQFSYYELDRLRTIEPTKNNLLDRNDRDEIYQIYSKIYKAYIKENNDNIADFYVWMVENWCVYSNIFIKKLNRIFIKNNPFNNDYYVLDASRYLYNKELIDEPQTFKKSKTYREQAKDRVPKNEYRLQFYKRERVP